VTIRIIVMAFIAFVLLITCQSIAQDNSTNLPAAGAEPTPAGPSSEPSGAAKPATPSGIPTDVLGIADAMGRPFTVAFIMASVIGVWSVVERLVILRRRRVIPKAFVEDS